MTLNTSSRISVALINQIGGGRLGIHFIKCLLLCCHVVSGGHIIHNTHIYFSRQLEM